MVDTASVMVMLVLGPQHHLWKGEMRAKVGVRERERERGRICYAGDFWKNFHFLIVFSLSLSLWKKLLILAGKMNHSSC